MTAKPNDRMKSESRGTSGRGGEAQREGMISSAPQRERAERELTGNVMHELAVEAAHEESK